MMKDELDTTIKLAIYRITADTGSIPSAAAVASATQASQSDVVAAFQRLHQKRLLVPEPGDPTRIRMAPPFSGIPTAFPVDALGRRYYANCVWDAYGVAAALDADAVIPASDGFSGEPLTLEIRDHRPVLHPYIAHFAVPAANWWDDIVFT
jgi:DNA-binding transcriptional MocR family regulator